MQVSKVLQYAVSVAFSLGIVCPCGTGSACIARQGLLTRWPHG